MSARRKFERQSLFALALLPVMMAASGAAAQSLPSGGGIQAGNVAFDSSVAGTLTINQTSSKAIINWTDFSIGAGNSVQFNNGTGATLNRVTGGVESAIDGTLNATGSVYLINPNGIIVNSGGVVNVGGSFVASTLDLTNANFLAGGDLTFAGSNSGRVVNSGVINVGQVGTLGGDVALIASSLVLNDGNIDARNGTAALVHGTSILMRDSRLNDGKFVVQVGGTGQGLQLGAIQAAQIELRANGGSIYAQAGNTNYLTRATGTATIAGRVFLTAGGTANSDFGILDGAITARDFGGLTGGRIVTDGTNIQVRDGGEITAADWLYTSRSVNVGGDMATVVNDALTRGNVSITATSDLSSGILNISDNLFNNDGFTLTVAAKSQLFFQSPFVTIDTGGLSRTVVRGDSSGTGTGFLSIAGTNLTGNGTVAIYTNIATGQYGSTRSNIANNTAFAGTLQLYDLVNTTNDIDQMKYDIFASYALGRDIDASGFTGYSGGASYGDFDGLGHTISNLNIDTRGDGQNSGLFTDFHGTARDVTITGSVKGDSFVGAFAGQLSGGVLDNVFSSASVQSAQGRAGGLTGYMDAGTIRNSGSSGAVTATDIAGGLAGIANGTISNSYATGSVSGGSSSVGGLVGRANNVLAISDSFATGPVSSTSSEVGGLVGSFGPGGGSVTNSYASGNISSSGSNIGGLIGASDGNLQVANSYATGTVSGGSSVGGLIGGAVGSTSVTGSSATGAVSGSGYLGGLIGYMGGATSVSTSYAEGAVSGDGSGSFIGGLIGYMSTTGSLQESYATGNVGVPYSMSAGYDVGGLIGGLFQGDVNNVYATGNVAGNYRTGGLIGSAYAGGNGAVTAVISNAYASGSVVGGSFTGNLFGYVGAYGGSTLTVRNLYYDTGTGGGLAAYGGTFGSTTFINVTPLSTAAAFLTASYTFDNNAQWVQLDGFTRPMLASEINAPVNGVTTINNVHQLQLLAYGANPNAQFFSNYRIGRDFSAAQTQGNVSSVFGTGGFVPLFDGSGYGFGGQLDGGGHTITGLTVSRNVQNVGLFSLISYNGRVSDLNLSGGSMTGGSNTRRIGSVAGWYFSDGSTTGLNISDVRSSVAVNSLSYPGYPAYAGGLVGYSTKGRIDRSAYTGILSAFDAGGTIAGGIAGGTFGGMIRDSRVSGTLLAGFNYTAIGGIAGEGYGTDFQSVLMTGTITPGTQSNRGAIVAFYDGNNNGVAGSIQNARWNSDTTPLNAVATNYSGLPITDALGKTAAELQNSSTLAAVYGAGFDFRNVWAPGSAASASSDNTAHFAELYRADNVLLIDGRGSSIIYGGTPSAIPLTYGPVRAGDMVTRNAMVSSAVNSTTDVGSYAATVTGGSAVRQGGGAYRVVRLADVTVTPKTLTAMLTGTITKTYDQSTTASLAAGNFTLSGVINNDVVSVASNVGTYDTADAGSGKTVTSGAITLAGLDMANYTVVGSASAAIGTIDPLALTAALTGTTTKVYDRTDTASLVAGNFSLTGVLSGDTVSVATTSGTYDNFNAGTGKTVTSGALTLTGTSASNYSITGTASGAIGEITQKTLTAMLTAPGKTYNGMTSVGLQSSNFSFASGSVITGDTVTASAAGNAGNFNSARVLEANTVTATGVTLSGTGSGNYILASTTVSGAGTITPATLTGGLTGSTTKIYDGTPVANLTAANYTLSGTVVTGDAVMLNNPIAGAYDNKNVNITIFFPGGPGGTPIPITETKDVTATVGLTGADASNYVLANADAQGQALVSGKIGTITQRDLMATLGGSATRVYDGTVNASDADLTYAAGTGFIANDSLTFGRSGAGTVTYDDRNAGTGKVVTVTDVALTGGADAGNYRLTSNTASAAVGTITPASVTASLGGTATRTYDGTTAAPTANTTVSLAGVYGIDTVTAAATSATYDTKDAGTGKTVTATVGLGGTNAGNYVLASNTASATIGQIDRAILTALLSGPVSRVYDATTTAAVTGSNLGLSGVVTGDTVSVGATGATYDTANAGTSKAVTATGLTLSGTGAINYSLASTSVTANVGTITQRALQASLTGTTTKTYDAMTTAAMLAGNYALAGVLAGDIVTLNNPTIGTYADANAGTAKTVTVNGLALGGTSAGNYTVNASASGAIGTVNAKALTAALTGTTSRTYDATTTAALAGSNYSLSGVIAGDTVTLNNPTVGSYADANAGTGKTVSVNGIALTGASAGNYTVNASASGAIGTISAKALTAALTGTISRTYDATTTAALAGSNYSLSGVIAGDSVTLNNPTVGSYADANAGTGKTVTVNGLALGGAAAGNYTVNASASGTIGTILQRALTAGLTGTTTRVYDGTTTASLTGSNYSLSGVLAGDTVTLNNPTTGAYADRNAGTGKTVTVNGLAIGGSSAGNYSLASTTTSGAIGVITPRGITITADAKVKNRNDVDPVLTSAITTGSLVQGDSLTGALARASGEAVGTYAITQGSLSAGTNYAVTFNGATFTIALGIPPIDDTLFPINRPSDGFGSGGGVVSGAAQADVTGATPGLSFVEQIEQAQDAEEDASLDQICPLDEQCPVAPYPSSGFTSASIRFEGYSR